MKRWQRWTTMLSLNLSPWNCSFLEACNRSWFVIALKYRKVSWRINRLQIEAKSLFSAGIHNLAKSHENRFYGCIILSIWIKYFTDACKDLLQPDIWKNHQKNCDFYALERQAIIISFGNRVLLMEPFFQACLELITILVRSSLNVFLYYNQ